MSLKQFSTRPRASLALGAAIALAGGLVPTIAPAQAAPVAPTPVATASGAPAVAAATPSSTRATAPLELADGAPDKHVVVRGDTLWDISATFLKSPWRWPEVWQLNREQIKDPHWIYPGDIVYLDRSGATPRLRLARAVGSGRSDGADGRGDGVARLEPVVRASQLDRTAISTVSMAAIEAFINRPLIVDENGLATAPRIIATQEDRVYLGRGDRAYVRGMRGDGPSNWHVYRPARPLLDPDTRKPIAYEALYLGTVQVVRKGDPTTVQIVGNAEEIGEGDRLVPAETAQTVNFVPRAPEHDIGGRIVSVYRGVTQVGRNSVVALNIGQRQGLDVGHVLTVQLTGKVAKDRQTNELVKLPNEPIGQLLVFRTFDNIAYGLIVEASQSISVGDSVVNP